ncbi:MAG: hypothetical protein Rhims3KO_27680 [Hyphomicrobiales bacterium]
MDPKRTSGNSWSTAGPTHVLTDAKTKTATHMTCSTRVLERKGRWHSVAIMANNKQVQVSGWVRGAAPAG